MIAVIHNGRVHALYPQAPAGSDIFDLRDVSGIAGIEVGWLAYPDGVFVAPVSTVSVEQLLGHLAVCRFAAESAGFTTTLAGESVPVSTRREDRDGLRDTMSGILVGLRRDGGAFKFADGRLRPASNVEMRAIIAEAFAHVQAAFDAEAVVAEAIRAVPSTIADRAGVEAAFAAAL